MVFTLLLQGFIVLVTGQLAAGQVSKFKEVFAPLVRPVIGQRSL